MSDVSSEVDTILKRFGEWAVTDYGVEGVDGSYSIEADRLWEPDWAQHMEKKRRVNMDDFLAALLLAQDVHSHVREVPSAQRRKRFLVLRRDGYRCNLCGRTPLADRVKLEVDHIVPRSRGGSNHESNLWTLCRDCNQGRSNLSLEEES